MNNRRNAGIICILSTSAQILAAFSLTSFEVSDLTESAHVSELSPAVACNGDSMLTAWMDERKNPQHWSRRAFSVFCRRFDLQGQPLDATALDLETEINAQGRRRLQVVASGRDYFVLDESIPPYLRAENHGRWSRVA